MPTLGCQKSSLSHPQSPYIKSVQRGVGSVDLNKQTKEKQCLQYKAIGPFGCYNGYFYRT